MKIIAIYDNEGKTLDRYTIVTNYEVGPKHNGRFTYDALSASENGLGVFMWVQCIRGSHLGKKIQLTVKRITRQNQISITLTKL